MGSPRIDLNVHPELRSQLDAESLVMELFQRGFEEPPEGSVGKEFRTPSDVETRWEGEPNNSVSVLSVGWPSSPYMTLFLNFSFMIGLSKTFSTGRNHSTPRR